MTTHVRSYIYL